MIDLSEAMKAALTLMAFQKYLNYSLNLYADNPVAGLGAGLGAGNSSLN